jgi:hypothetical protein
MTIAMKLTIRGVARTVGTVPLISAMHWRGQRLSSLFTAIV